MVIPPASTSSDRACRRHHPFLDRVRHRLLEVVVPHAAEECLLVGRHRGNGLRRKVGAMVVYAEAVRSKRNVCSSFVMCYSSMLQTASRRSCYHQASRPVEFAWPRVIHRPFPPSAVSRCSRQGLWGSDASGGRPVTLCRRDTERSVPLRGRLPWGARKEGATLRRWMKKPSHQPLHRRSEDWGRRVTHGRGEHATVYQTCCPGDDSHLVIWALSMAAAGEDIAACAAPGVLLKRLLGAHRCP